MDSQDAKAATLTPWGDFVAFMDGNNEVLLNWQEIASVRQGNECCVIRMKGNSSLNDEFLAPVDYKELRAFLAEKTKRD